MKKLFCMFILLLMIAFCAICEAAIDLPWSTTFDCADWEQDTTLNCSNLIQWGGWTCNGTKTQITSAANYSSATGGKGARFYYGDGTNVNSACLRVDFTTAQPELWIRWYQRYEAGFQWSALIYDKMLYIHSAGDSDVVPEPIGSDSFQLASNRYGHARCDNCGWATIFGGSSSDGSWHCYEIHIKMDTNGSDGIGEWWIDGVKKISTTNVNWGTQPGWTWFHFLSNQSSPNNGRCMAIDFDDIVVSNTGYIGPINNSDSPPSPPPVVEIH